MNTRLERRCTALAASVLAATALAVAGPQPASAHHSHDGYYQIHLADMHVADANNGPEDEAFCVEVISGSTHANALAAVNRALFSSGTPRWHLARASDGTTDSRIDLFAMPNPCSSYPQSIRSGIDIEFHVRASNATVQWCNYQDNVSCVHQDIEVDQGDHVDYAWMYVYLDADHLGSDAIINHEVGHVFGFMDGGPNSGTWDTSCPSSIMHRFYGCTNNDWITKPTDGDITKVRSIIRR
jgi:hypothetical protein